jgi:hypothetical protein
MAYYISPPKVIYITRINSQSYIIEETTKVVKIDLYDGGYIQMNVTFFNMNEAVLTVDNGLDEYSVCRFSIDTGFVTDNLPGAEEFDSTYESEDKFIKMFLPHIRKFISMNVGFFGG